MLLGKQMYNRGHQASRKSLSHAQQGMHLLERGLSVAHTLHGAYKTGAAIAAIAAPLLAAV